MAGCGLKRDCQFYASKAEHYQLTSEDKEKRRQISGVMGRPHTRQLTVDTTHFPGIYEDMAGVCDLDDDDRLWRAHLRDGLVTATFLPLIMYHVDSLPTQLAGLALLPVGGCQNEFVRLGRASVDIKNVWAVKDCTLPLTEIVVV